MATLFARCTCYKKIKADTSHNYNFVFTTKQGSNTMQIIDAQSDFLLKAWAKQPFKENTLYRPLNYIRQIPLENGLLLFNMLTGEMIELDENEKKIFLGNLNFSIDFLRILVEKWFLVPEGTVDADISKQMTALFQSINSIYSEPKIKTFIILPTTDCNARCFYCYELGRSRKWMTEKTAKDVIDYIIRRKADCEIKIHWFGGEPLYNAKIIDFISEELKNKGVQFYSHMISNGYLFDAEMIARAKELWKLKKIQITIDGTEKVYNRVKAYIYKDCDNPFKRVINNIEQLLKNDINVQIRLNMDMHNIDDLFELSEYLLEKFRGNKNLFIYPHLLYDCGKKIVNNRNDDYLNTKFYELKNLLDKNDSREPKYVPIVRFKNHCMADTDTSIMILPEGEIGKCEHCTDDNFIGSIYDEKIDITKLNYFKRMSAPLEKCDDCEMRPACVLLECCPEYARACTPTDKRTKENALDGLIKYVYNYKKGKLNET